MMKWTRMKAGSYKTIDGAWEIQKRPNDYSWDLTHVATGRCFNAESLKMCKEWAIELEEEGIGGK